MTSASLREQYRRDGWWDDDTFADFIDRRVEVNPSTRVRIWSDEAPATTTVGDVRDRSQRIAAGLRARGIGAGDVVAYQMPSWAPTLEVLWAGFHLGATMVPIIHFYGPREVSFILRQSGARALVTVGSFGGIDHLANLESIRADLDVETVVVADTAARVGVVPGAVSLSSLADHEPLVETARVDPDEPAMIGYTSGTTADPKGVIHSHRSLLAEVRQLSARMGSSARPTVMASPLAHMTGMLGGSLVPLQNGDPIELLDRWDPGRVLSIIAQEDLSPGGGATIFLTSLLDHPDFGPDDVARIPRFGLGGAPVPTAVAERAEALGIRITRAYGSTEHPSITASAVDAPAAKRTGTDGPPLDGVEIRLVDADDHEVATGQPGEILSRGPDLFIGYTDPALTSAAIDADGWYRTGDVGILDPDGYLTITDRLSDVIIRGGLNLSAAKIEEQVVTMPGVAEVAVVAAPDARLGERACAVVRTIPGAAIDLPTLQSHLAASGLPKQQWPEELRVIDEFDRTPSGKIKKRTLRALVAEPPAG